MRRGQTSLPAEAGWRTPDGESWSLRAPSAGLIIEGSIPGGMAMCHEWWLRRQFEEREASREMWDEFDRTRPLSDSDVSEEQTEVTLEQEETPQLAAND